MAGWLESKPEIFVLNPFLMALYIIMTLYIVCFKNNGVYVKWTKNFLSGSQATLSPLLRSV